MRKGVVILIFLFSGLNLFSQFIASEDTLKKWHIAASKYYRMDNFSEALIFCDMLLIARPTNCKYIAMKGSVLMAAKDYDASEKILLSGVKHSCDKVRFYLLLAAGQQSSMNYSKALQYMDSVLTLKPDSADLYIEKAHIYTLLRDRQNDIKNLQKAKTLGSQRAAELLEIIEHPEK